MSVLQSEFNDLVRRYNEDYVFWLDCVASGDFSRSTQVLMNLKDSYEAIIETQRVANFKFEIELYLYPLDNEKLDFDGFRLKKNELERIKLFLRTIKRMPVFSRAGKQPENKRILRAAPGRDYGLLP